MLLSVGESIGHIFALRTSTTNLLLLHIDSDFWQVEKSVTDLYLIYVSYQITMCA